MIRLERAGRLDESAVPEAVTKQYPANYRSKRNRWHAFGGRARVLLVNNDKVPIDERPKSFDDLPNLARRRSVAIAKPTFGMTATHAAAIFAIWGDDRAKKWFRALKSADVKVLAGNKQSAEAVGAGSAAIGLTDTDDALDEIAKERNVTMIVPPIDGSIESSGALIIPNSVAKIEGCRHPRSADRLIAFLLRAEIEDELSRSAGMVGAHVDCKFKPAWINERFLRADVDFERVADCWNDAMEFLRDEFLSP
jgi:iron(III) transport system substrate-binding protein